LENLPWITKVWSLPRTRGQARLRDSWPVIRGLRQQHFDRSVDFGGNDRGAILSLVSGARQRLGAVDKTNLLYKICYSQEVHTTTLPPAWVQRHLQLLSAWNIPAPVSTRLEIVADPALAEEAARLLPAGMIVCHLGTSQPRKEWPLERWQEFYRLARATGFSLAFSSGTSERERALLAGLQKMEPKIFALPSLPSLKLFLAVLRRARAVIAGDTGPLHFAAGLGVPVVGLFGTPDSLLRTAPLYQENQMVKSAAPGSAENLLGAENSDDQQNWLADIRAGRVLATVIAAVGSH
jgi:ADP-heptose:LPS heptosyltransferase